MYILAMSAGGHITPSSVHSVLKASLAHTVRGASNSMANGLLKRSLGIMGLVHCTIMTEDRKERWRIDGYAEPDKLTVIDVPHHRRIFYSAKLPGSKGYHVMATAEMSNLV